MNSDACANERPCFVCWQFIGNRSERFGWRGHILCISAIEIDSGDFAIDAHFEIAAPARVAHKTMSAMPADTYALTFLPLSNIGSDCIDASRHFMTGHSRILESGPQTFVNENIAVANPARLDSDSNLPGGGLDD